MKTHQELCESGEIHGSKYDRRKTNKLNRTVKALFADIDTLTNYHPMDLESYVFGSDNSVMHEYKLAQLGRILLRHAAIIRDAVKEKHV